MERLIRDEIQLAPIVDGRTMTAYPQTMKHRIIDSSDHDEVTELFRSVFTASEGEEEGTLIGNLVSGLATAIDNKDIQGYSLFWNLRRRSPRGRRVFHAPPIQQTD